MKDIYIPIFCEDESKLDVSTLVLDSVRTGFPKNHIYVYITGNNSFLNSEIARRAFQLDKLYVIKTPTIKTNDQLVSMIFEREMSNSFILLDGDVVFWDNCEDVLANDLIAGRYIPEYQCPYTNTLTMPRLHTSFMLFEDVKQIKVKIKEYAYQDHLVPFNPISPVTVFNSGNQIFFDTCANLFQCIGGSPFKEETLNKYDHLGCSSYIDKVEAKCPELFEGSTEFQRDIKNRIQEAKGLWKKHDKFYAHVAV